MKKFILFSLVALFCHSLFSQVGIGNTDPKSTLDISATNIATPSNTDGILIPRVDDFPATNPTVDQDGMMVFATGNGTPSKGFYYWDNGSTSWVAISSGGGSDDDWYEENTTSPPTSNSADIFTDGNVGIGLSNVLYPLQIESPASSRTMSLLNENTGTSVTGIYNNIDESAAAASGSANGIVNSITRSNQSSISGVSNSFQNSTVNAGFAYLFGYQNSFGTSTSNTTFALINRFQGTTGTAYGTSNLIGGPITNFYGVDNHNIAGANLSGTFYGLYNSLTGSDSGDRYGVYTSFAETGSGDKYGEYITIATSAGGTHYGVYSDVQNGTGYAGYFLGRTSLGNGTTNRYLMPASDGTSGQVMTTDGAGNISFTTPTTGAEKIDDLIDGKSDSDGTNDGSSIFLGINAGAADDSSDNKNVGLGWSALQNNSTGIENIAIGNRALQTNTTGGGNIAIGYQSLLNNTTSLSNVAVGGYSMRDNTTGAQNTAMGSGALINNETGNANVALGYQSNYEMISNNSNTGIGYQALMRTQGNSNTALGREAGEYVDGNNNVLLGERAGSAVTTISRSGSIMIGYEAGYGNTGNNKLFIENSSANADNALIYGEFDTNILRTNSEFQIGNPTGTGYAFPSTDGTAGQVLTTDGAGQISFTTPISGAEKIDDLTDGKSDSDGTQDGSSIFLGVGSGSSDNSADNRNVAIGFEAMNSNIVGGLGVAIGYQALANAGISSTHRSVAIGYQSLNSNSTGIDNVGVGIWSLYNLGNGGYNTVLGGRSMIDLTTGDRNVALGYQAGDAVTSGDGNIFIGYNAGGSGIVNNKLYIDNSSNANPLIYGEFDTNILRANGELQVGIPAGTGYAFPTIDGTNGQVLTTDGAGQLGFTTLSFTDTQNTLDEAYDEGGAGAGRTITADNGAVTINGQDGFMVTGGFGSGDIVSVTGIGTRMFFNPNKAAFRAGSVGSGGIYDPTAWDDVNIGQRSFAVNIGTIASGSYSFASGVSTEASGYASTAMGYISEASGWYSTAMGEGTIATGWGEMAVGSYNSTGTSRVFVVGNGTSDASRSNAFEVYDSGLIRFNDAYSFPTIDGSANQVLRTNGAGTVTWATLSGEATTASNGLTETGNDVRLGGTLTQNTTIDNGNFDLEISSTGTATEGLSITKTDNAASGNIALDIIKTTNGTGFGTGVNVSMNGTGNGSLYSYSANITNSGSGTKIAYNNVFSGSGTGTLYANRNQFLGTGSGSKYGVHNTFGTSVTSAKFGVYNDFDSSSGNYYGMSNNMVGATNSAVFGVNNTLSGTGTGAKTGVSNSFSGANGNANIYIGMDNSFNDTGNGDRWGVRTNLDGTGTGTHYGSFNDLTGTGSGTKYGTYNSISSGAGGTHYGTYNEVNNSNGWAGYFIGKNYVSDAIGINNPNPDGRLDIIHNSTSETSPHIMITALNANSGSRITFDNAAETTNSWVLFARADDTPGAGVLNFYSSEITANVLRLESDGKIGIMRNPTTNALEVEGDASKTTAGAFVANSDRRLKKEIKSISGETALDKIEKMRGVTYLWNDDKTGTKRPEGLQYGFIAQELMEVFPEKVTKDNLGFYQTAYGDYDPIFVEAIKELKTEVETLKDENQKLKAQLSNYESLEARLSALESGTNMSQIISEEISEKKK